METTRTPHTLTLTSPSAVSLWKGEFLGQISDGMWENSRPYDHWKFWHDCDVALGAVNNLDLAEGNWKRPLKVGYNFAALIPIVGERIMKCGRFGKANPQAAVSEDIGGCVLDHIPNTYEEYVDLEATAETQPSYMKRFFEIFTPERAEKFYSTIYTVKEMKEDIKRIKTALKSTRN